MLVRISVVLAILAVALHVACAGEETDATSKSTATVETPKILEPVPTSAYVPGGMHGSTSFLFDRPPTLDWQILDSERIVIANFVSATAAVETLPPETPGYRPMHVLRFRASEYLKGTGPSEFTVEVVDHSPEWHRERRNGVYATEAEALVRATATLAERNTAWDDRSGVLFLRGPFSSVASQSSESSETRSGTETNQVFVLTNQRRTNQSFSDYTVDTLGRGWLPASEAASSGTRSTGGGSDTTTSQISDTEFITDGTAQPPPVISASQLRTRISEIEAMLNAGDGSIAYTGCVYGKLVRPWYYQDWEPGPPRRVSIASAAAAGTEFGNRRDTGEQAYDTDEWYFTGERAELFEVGIRDTDDNPGNGFNNSYRTARPLVAGEYQLQLHNQIEPQKPCNFRKPHDEPGHFLYHVTVTAPAGTLHEAFFDPITVGTAVKADGSNGVLKPTSFTVGGTATELTSLEWSSNQVVLTLGTHVSLSGQVLDFIGLDGNIILSIFADEATANSAARTYTWSTTSQPWADGDKLMLRIRPVGTEIFLTNLPSSMVQGVTHWFTVNLTNLNRSRSYSYRLSADNTNIAFHNSACHSAPVNVTVSAGETSYARQHALLGCGTPGSTVTATLLEGTTEVDTTTYSVTVMPPPPPSVAIESLASSMEEGESDSFVINASHLDTAHGHTIRLTTDNANMGFDAECTDREKEFTLSSRSATYVNSSRLYGCTAPGGTVTATLLQGETEVATATYDMTVTPPPPPSLEFQYLPSTLESGSDVFFRVNAKELESANSYTVKVTTDNADLGYNRDCTTRQYSEMAPAGRTSYAAYFVLYACASPGGTVTATLLDGTTEVATATQDVEVTT